MVSWNRYDGIIRCNPLLKQGHLQPVAQDCSPSGFSHLQGRRLPHCSVTLTVTKCFWVFRQSLLYLNMCPWPLVQSLGTSGKNLALSAHQMELLLQLLRIISAWVWVRDGCDNVQSLFPASQSKSPLTWITIILLLQDWQLPTNN